MKENRPSSFQIWWTATRPHTLTAALSPCVVAYALCQPPWDQQVAWTLFCITVQIGTNLHNDYSDFVQGADTDKRVGHARATARGWLTPTETCTAAVLCLLGTLGCGCYLAIVTQQVTNPVVWFVIFSSIFNAFAYTAGPFPLGYIGLSKWSIAYAGLGEVFVLLYFGYVATLMLPYLVDCQASANPRRTTTVDWGECMAYATAVGVLATNIIVVNNLRDRLTDVQAGKRTTAVRFGRNFSLIEYVACLVVAVGAALWVAATRRHGFSVWSLLPLLVLPMAISETFSVTRKEGAQLNPHVGGAAKLEFLFCLLVAVGKLSSLRT